MKTYEENTVKEGVLCLLFFCLLKFLSRVGDHGLDFKILCYFLKLTNNVFRHQQILEFAIWIVRCIVEWHLEKPQSLINVRDLPDSKCIKCVPRCRFRGHYFMQNKHDQLPNNFRNKDALFLSSHDLFVSIMKIVKPR